MCRLPLAAVVTRQTRQLVVVVKKRIKIVELAGLIH
jgi:hypothetical protein